MSYDWKSVLKTQLDNLDAQMKANLITREQYERGYQIIIARMDCHELTDSFNKTFNNLIRW